MKLQHLKYLLISVLIFFSIAACTTMQPLTGDLSRENIASLIKPGSDVIVITKTGERHSIKVSSITEDRIIGTTILEEERQYSAEEEQFRFEDIDRIETRKPGSAAKVVGTAAGVGGIVVLYAISYVIYTAIIFEVVKALAF